MLQVEPLNDAHGSENRRLQFLVAQLTANNEMLSLQLRQQERHSEKRRREVASLHQACAKHKRARVECAQRQQKRRRSSETNADTPAPSSTPPPPSPSPPDNNDVSVGTPEVSLRTHTVKEAFDICFGECGRRRHQRTLEAQFDTKLKASLEESERDFQAAKQRLFRLIDEEKTRRQAADEQRYQNMHLDRSIDQHMLMFRRRMNGSADAGWTQLYIQI